MKTSDFDYELPPECIAQTPWPRRDECKMLVLDRATHTLSDCLFYQIEDYLNPGDLLIANETRVLPARLLGKKRHTGGQAEVFLLREIPSTDCVSSQSATWEALVKPGKRLKPSADTFVDFTDKDNRIVLSARVIDWAKSRDKGERIIELSTPLASISDAIHEVGLTPLPPYIKGYTGNTELYQTVYSKSEHSAAAPTAGLHFTPELIERIKAKGVNWKTVDLEVGLDTFRIVDEDNPTDHVMHTEYYSVSPDTIDAINETKNHGGRVIAVGTTSVRSLESAWDVNTQQLLPRDRAQTSLYLLPGSTFHVVDALITNFHVPKSTLMMLVSAFYDTEHIMEAYQHAICSNYRFLSFGDAMFIQ